MEYSSFYGGRRGASFVIVERYATIEEMVNAFAQGGAYTTVKYDEYVIIDTVSKNDPDNGKVYRRGYDYNNDLGGAIYIGQIVGPGGLAPQAELATIEEVHNMIEREGFEYRRGTGEYSTPNNLIPGKYMSGQTIKYNDKIEWEYCSVRDIDSHDTTAYVGFKFPYTVIDYTANSVNPYYNRNNQTATFTNINLVDRTDDQTHPFYEKWDIKIPKGIKGDTLKNFRIMTADNTIQPYTGQATDIANHAEVLVYDYYNYDAKEAGDKQTIYLGKNHTIKSLAVDGETGILTVKYNDGTQYSVQVIYSWSSMAGKESDPATQAAAERLSVGGIWFVVED